MAADGRRHRHPRKLCRFRLRDLGHRRARPQRRLGDLSAGREPACRPHPRHDDRAGADRAGDRRCGPRRSPATSPKSSIWSGVLAVEMFVDADGRAAGQRARAAAAQFRPLDDRRLRHQPVRAAGAGDLRPAARLGRAPLRRGDEEPDRRRMSRSGATRSTTRWRSSISTARARCSPAARWATSPG